MQVYKFLFSLFLFIILIIVVRLPEYLDNTLEWFYYPILNFNLSFRFILIFFLLVALLIIPQIKDLKLSEIISLFVYITSSICTLLSKKMLITVIFSELMAISASFIIASSNKDNSYAIRYICVHLFSGIILTEGLAIENFNLITIGLLINCACFPFSFLIVDAYSVTSLHCSSYLYLFTTKISFLIVLLHTYKFWKNYTEIIALFGSITIIYSVVFTSLEQNIRRFLAYNAVGQIGILITAGSLLTHSRNAIPLLALNIIFSIIYQMLFIFLSNEIISITKTVNFNRVIKFTSIEGIYALIAILTMTAFPGTAGFISKSYIASEIKICNPSLKLYENLYKILNLLLYLSVGFKFIYYMFNIENKPTTISIRKTSKIIMAILSFLCIVIGNPYLPIYNKYTIFNIVYNMQNILSHLISLFFITLLFIPLHNLFLPRINFKMDIDWIFRASILHIVLFFNKSILKLKKNFFIRIQNLTNWFIILYYNNNIKIKKLLNYDSISFVSVSSLFLISILLILLCLNH